MVCSITVITAVLCKKQNSYLTHVLVCILKTIHRSPNMKEEINQTPYEECFLGTIGRAILH